MKLFRAANEPKQFIVIPDGDHNDPQTRDCYIQLESVYRSFAKHLTSNRH